MGGSERSGGSDHDRAGANVGRHGNSRSSRPRQPPPGDLRVDSIDRSIDRSIQATFVFHEICFLVRTTCRGSTLAHHHPRVFSKHFPFRRKLERGTKQVGRRDFTVRVSIGLLVDRSDRSGAPAPFPGCRCHCIPDTSDDYISSEKRISRLFRQKSHSAIDRVALDPYRLYYLYINTIPST